MQTESRKVFVPKLDRQSVARCTALGLVILAYLVLPNARPDLNAINADDSESYLALSYAMTHGLGYTRNLVPGQYIPHMTWPPGLPLLLAPVMAFMQFPLNWLLVKLVMVFTGIAGIILAWLILRRLSGSLGAADLGAAFLSMCPFYWLASHMIWSEIPSVTFSLGCLLLIDKYWAGRSPQFRQVIGIGLISGLVMLIRGTAIGLAFVPLAYLVNTPRRALPEPSQQLRIWTRYVAAFLIPFLIWNVRNRAMGVAPPGLDGIGQVRMLLASNPIDPASPLRSVSEIVSDLRRNVGWEMIYRIPEQLLPGLWLTNWQTWPAASFLAAVLTAALGYFALTSWRAALPLIILILPNIVILLVYAWGGSIRFWIPISSIVALLLVIGLYPRLAMLSRPIKAILAVSALVAWFGNLAVYALEFERNPYAVDFGDLVQLFQHVRNRSIAPQNMLTNHEALYTFMTGFPAPYTAETLGIIPKYTHVITHHRSVGYATSFAIPFGSVLQDQVGDWQLYSLPAPAPLSKLR